MEYTPFHEFLIEVMKEGKIVFRSTKAPFDRISQPGVAFLAEAFKIHSAAVAGPPIVFDAETASTAAEFLRQSSWALVNHDERMADLEKRLNMPGSPRTPSQHLSADLTLRYLPQVLRRARCLNPDDPLVERVAKLLRRWPLSGVLSDVEEAPTGPMDLGGHPGLSLLYAERLARNDRPGWRPDRSTLTWEYYQLVSMERSMFTGGIHDR
jgi:MoxR-vWA-beta-propeller ternary system domain bpX4